MSEHTPGPWMVERTYAEDIEGTTIQLGYWIAGPEDGDMVVDASQIGILSEADAQLIAAAPDLFAACKAALNWPDEDENGVAWDEEIATPAYRAFRQQLRAAIAKAQPPALSGREGK